MLLICSRIMFYQTKFFHSQSTSLSSVVQIWTHSALIGWMALIICCLVMSNITNKILCVINHYRSDDTEICGDLDGLNNALVCLVNCLWISLWVHTVSLFNLLQQPISQWNLVPCQDLPTRTNLSYFRTFPVRLTSPSSLWGMACAYTIWRVQLLWLCSVSLFTMV